MQAVVREAKREAEDRFGTKLSQNFETNRMFWNEAEKSTGRGDESKG